MSDLYPLFTTDQWGQEKKLTGDEIYLDIAKIRDLAVLTHSIVSRLDIRVRILEERAKPNPDVTMIESLQAALGNDVPPSN